MKKTRRKEKSGGRRFASTRRRKSGAICAAAVALAATGASLGGTPSWAQFPGYYSGAVQPQLDLQRQAENAARRSNAVAPSPSSSPYRAPTAPRQATASANARTSTAQETPSGEAEHVSLEAAIIAVGRYAPESGFLPLPGCSNDARALKNWLDANFDEAFRQTDEYRRKVAVLSDAENIATGEPTRENILNLLRQKASVPCGRLFVSFAGHGVGASGKSFLCPADTRAFDPETFEADVAEAVEANGRSGAVEAANANNLIAVSEVLEILKDAEAKEVILLLDACRDGGENSFMREFADLLSNADENFKKRDGGAFYVLTSCSLGEKALETARDGEMRGAFGYRFVEGLAGPADYVGCCDGAVTLVEAYNYTYSKVAEDARREGSGTQTPELFMSNVGLRKAPTLARVALKDLKDLSTADVDAWRDQEYLLYVGRVLSDVKWTKNVNAIAERSLDAVLEGAPNNALALSLRGVVRRKLGDYVGSLDDWNKVGQKFQLYVKSRRSDDPAKPPRDEAERLTVRLAENVGGAETGATATSTDLLTVAEIATDAKGVRWGRVVEKNSVALGENAGWLRLDATVWDWRLASRAITATEMQSTRRVLDYNAASTGAAPGRNYIQGGGGGSTPGPLYH